MGGTGAVRILGVTLIGVTPETGRKLLLTFVFVLGALVIGWILRFLLGWLGRVVKAKRFGFWSRQAVSLITGIIVIVGVISIWFDNPARLATAAGLVTAGIAFALQRVITAIAGYFVILRGKTFNVGDRIVMGGVRGDVIALTFTQTRIMEMGEPPPTQAAPPAVWVHSRQFTGRIVTVSNAKIFDDPVFNYTRHFPYLWDEMHLPVSYTDDREKAEQILLEAARHHALTHDKMSEEDLADLEERYQIHVDDFEPKVYWRLTDNWIEMALRFLVPDHGARGIKDAMSREIIANLDKAGIGIASGTYDVVGMPKLEVALTTPLPSPGRGSENPKQ